MIYGHLELNNHLRYTRDQHNIMKTFASLGQSALLVFDMKYSGSFYSGSAQRSIIKDESQAGNRI